MPIKHFDMFSGYGGLLNNSNLVTFVEKTILWINIIIVVNSVE